MHAMRGIAAHSNGFHTCRAIHVLQILLGSIDVPGGFRYKPPYPKAAHSMPRPAGRLTYTQMLNSRGGIECDLYASSCSGSW